MYSSRSASTLIGVRPLVQSHFSALTSFVIHTWKHFLNETPWFSGDTTHFVGEQPTDWPQSWRTKEKLVPAERLLLPAVIFSTLILLYRSIVAICISRHSRNQRYQPQVYAEIKLKSSICMIPWGFIWLLMNPRRQLSSRKRKHNKKPLVFWIVSTFSSTSFVKSFLEWGDWFSKTSSELRASKSLLGKVGNLHRIRHVLSLQLFFAESLFGAFVCQHI